jgi:hypothetical protein
MQPGERSLAQPEFDTRAIDALQTEKTREWHERDFAPSRDGLLALAEENHRCNFELWHEEDRARRDDLGFEHVYRAKRAIDRWNQRRNDFIEQMDRFLVERLPPFPDSVPMNSETPGSIVDRLSINALRSYHMAEEAERPSAPEAQREACRKKLAVIHRQRADLLGALDALLKELHAGTRGFRVYFQFKMYNDPALNPELYASRKPAG